MNYAPVIIPTLNRYYHLKACIESLAKCTGAQYTVVYIGVDYPSKPEHWEGYTKIIDYLDNCGHLGFKELIVIKRKHNYGLGPNGNYSCLKEMVLKEYDTFISSEDDNVFSPCFLDFMNKSLSHYQHDKRVSSICGYLPYNSKVIHNKIVLTPFVTAWGMGHWKDKEVSAIEKKIYIDNLFKNVFGRFSVWKFSPNLYRMMCHMIFHDKLWGDVCSSIYNLKEHKYQVRPCVNLVNNTGFDGSGVNCEGEDVSKFYNNKISQRQYYYQIDSEAKMNRSVYFLYKLDSSTHKAVVRALKDLYYVLFPDKLKEI